MTVKDVMTLLESPDRVRVIKDGEEIYNQYFANMQVDKEIIEQIGDAEVKRFRAVRRSLTGDSKNWVSFHH